MSESDFGGEDSQNVVGEDDSSNSWNWWPWSRKAEADFSSETGAKTGAKTGASEVIETPEKEKFSTLLLEAGNSP
jgi:hypothetical protein